MNRATYRKHRATLRANGLFALRWIPAADASIMFAIHRPASDPLAQRADMARIEAKHGTPNPGAMAFRLTRNVTQHDKNVGPTDKDCH